MGALGFGGVLARRNCPFGYRACCGLFCAGACLWKNGLDGRARAGGLCGGGVFRPAQIGAADLESRRSGTGCCGFSRGDSQPACSSGNQFCHNVPAWSIRRLAKGLQLQKCFELVRSGWGFGEWHGCGFCADHTQWWDIFRICCRGRVGCGAPSWVTPWKLHRPRGEVDAGSRAWDVLDFLRAAERAWRSL